jgi:acetyl-CoA synthetase
MTCACSEAFVKTFTRPFLLPKTRSGKIMRRLLRDVANNRKLGDTTTLADPTVVDEIKNRAEAETGQDES